MAITRIQAQKLCNSAEFELVTQSLGDTLKGLTSAQLRGKVQRSRTLRGKFADLFQRQTAAIRAGTGSKRGHSGEANARTQLKLQLFDEVLKRFETRLAQLDKQAERAAAAAARLKGKGAAQAAARAARLAKPKAEPAALKKSRARKAAEVVAAPAVKLVGKAAAKPAAKAPAKVPGKSPAKAPLKAAVKAAVQRATQVSPVVAVRSKVLGAHARTAQARNQAKRASKR